MQIGSAKHSGFIKCAFIRIAVSSMLSFQRTCSHTFILYIKKDVFSQKLHFFRLSSMHNSFFNLSVHLNVLFPPLVEFWNLNLAEDIV